MPSSDANAARHEGLPASSALVACVILGCPPGRGSLPSQLHRKPAARGLLRHQPAQQPRLSAPARAGELGEQLAIDAKRDQIGCADHKHLLLAENKKAPIR